jgi:hypothetical protein
MEIDTVPGYTLAFVVDTLYGLPKQMTVGVWELGDYDPTGQLPESHKLFLGTGEGFNNWKHQFEEGEESTGVVVRIRQAGFIHFESLGQLSRNHRDEQWLTFTDAHMLMPMKSIEYIRKNWLDHLLAVRNHLMRKIKSIEFS